MKREEIVKVLEDLLRMEDVLACMVTKKGLEGIVPPGMKVRDINLWKMLHDSTDKLFDIMAQFYDYKLERLYLELGKYTIIIAPISKAFGLIVLIPSLANMGLLDVEIENSKRKIKEIADKKDVAQQQ
ncbi:MAG: hypothetical protein ABID38_02265 [Candidatus Diapherotrites archaeon]